MQKCLYDTLHRVNLVSQFLLCFNTLAMLHSTCIGSTMIHSDPYVHCNPLFLSGVRTSSKLPTPTSFLKRSLILSIIPLFYMKDLGILKSNL